MSDSNLIISAWANMKTSREVAHMGRVDAIQFERAGTGPLIKTYKFDPTKVQKTPTILESAAVQSKKWCAEWNTICFHKF